MEATIKKDTIITLLIKVFIIMVPYYTFRSAIPQLADYVMVIVIALVFMWATIIRKCFEKKLLFIWQPS